MTARHHTIRMPRSRHTLQHAALLLCLLPATAGAAPGEQRDDCSAAFRSDCAAEPARVPRELSPAGGATLFRDATRASGLAFEHGFTSDQVFEADVIAAGVAAGDYDNDGDIDLYVVTGDIGPNLLFRNRGDGQFDEVSELAGVGLEGHKSSGPVFADADGDGYLDLLVGSTTPPNRPVLFLSNGDGTFRNATDTHLVVTKQTIGAAFGDHDRDGDLDLVLAHWGVTSYGSAFDLPRIEVLWRNDGHGVFEDISAEAGIRDAFPLTTVAGDVVRVTDFTFTPNFADVDDDGWPDLTLTSDFGTSKLLMNQAGVFVNATTSVISDENGMGGTVGDFDNDGDVDWFVSSIYDSDQVTLPGQNWGVTGNRLYRNEGNGLFSDVTETSGVREGGWGWGSCFADFDNDGHLDLLHVNGFPIVGEEFEHDPTRLFMNQGDGRFVERSFSLGIYEERQGRGVVCFDADRDGDLDVFVSNNQEPGRFYLNHSPLQAEGGGGFFNVRLEGLAGNVRGIGARVRIETGSVTLRRDIRAGSNFVSQDPAEAHFGVGANRHVSRLQVDWPDGEQTILPNLPANRWVTVRHPALGGPAVRVDRVAGVERTANP